MNKRLPFRLLSAACFFSALLLPQAALASADETGAFAIKGVGTSSCETFTQSREKSPVLFGRYGGWLMGYLTSLNQHTPETFDLAAWQELDLLATLLHNFCLKNPQKPYVEAVVGLVKLLHPQRLEKQSEPVMIKSGQGTDMQIYKEVLLQAQAILKREGLYTSTLDGLWGPGTKAAITAYQKKAGLPETGLPDQLFLYRIFAGPPLAQGRRLPLSDADRPAPQRPAARPAPKPAKPAPRRPASSFAIDEPPRRQAPPPRQAPADRRGMDAPTAPTDNRLSTEW